MSTETPRNNERSEQKPGQNNSGQRPGGDSRRPWGNRNSGSDQQRPRYERRDGGQQAGSQPRPDSQNPNNQNPGSQNRGPKDQPSQNRNRDNNQANQQNNQNRGQQNNQNRGSQQGGGAQGGSPGREDGQNWKRRRRRRGRGGSGGGPNPQGQQVNPNRDQQNQNFRQGIPDERNLRPWQKGDMNDPKNQQEALIAIDAQLAEPDFRTETSEVENPDAPKCVVCGVIIRNIYTSIKHPEKSGPAHFDCVVRELAKSNLTKLGRGKNIYYIGGGNFAIVRENYDRRGRFRSFEVIEKIAYEKKEG